MENEKTPFQKFIKVALIVCIILLVISFMIFNLKSCTTDNYSYVEIDYENLSQIREISKKDTEFTADIPDGSPIAIIETSLGTMKIRLYPEYAPKTVEQFVRLADSGYYDNTYFYRVQPDIYSVGGAENSDGTNTEKSDIANERVPSEINGNLFPFYGAFMTLQTYEDTNFWDVLKNDTKTFTGTQFLVCGSVEFTETVIESLNETNLPDSVKNAFAELGGIPNYWQQFTIFAQTYEGFDTLDKILSVTVENGETLKPEEDIKIISVRSSVYEKK
jgi:cyclophilin family peptidyl-prolyl cis-trans isomerase